MTPALRKYISISGWLVVAIYFAAILWINWDVCTNMYDPEGPWPGWWPLIWADLIYGGIGILVAVLVRLLWGRWARKQFFESNFKR